MDMPFEPAYAEPPHIALVLTWLDLDHTHDLSVAAVIEDIAADNFTVAITPSGKSTSRIYSAAYNWLEVSSTEEDMHVGEFILPDDHKPHTVESIKFPQSFTDGESPIVVCWFSTLSMGKDNPWRVKTYTTDASPYKFRLHIEHGADTDLRGAMVSWIAFPRLKQGVTGGVFATDDVPGRVTFDEGVVFEKAPQMVMGISALDYENGANLRMRLSSMDVDAKGWDWRMDSWGDSRFNTAAGAYVAIAAPKEEAGEGS